MAVVNIKDGPALSLTFVVGHNVDGTGGKQAVADILNFGAIGGVPGPVISQGKIVYGNNQGGQYSPVAYDEDPSAFALVMRDFGGNFTVHDPTAAGHPASMQWTQAQVATAIPLTQKAAANGVATLDASGVVPTNQLNVSGLNFLGAWNADTNTPALTNGTGDAGDFYKVSTAGTHDFGAGNIEFDVGDWVIYEGDVWQRVGSHEAVASVNGQTGVVVLTASDVGADEAGAADTVNSALTAHTGSTSNPHSVTKSQVGLGNADNTSDADKPVSTATQTALDAKLDKAGSNFVVYATDQNGDQTTVSYWPIAVPDSIAQRKDDGSLQIAEPTEDDDAATKKYVDDAISGVEVGGGGVPTTDQPSRVYVTDSEGDQSQIPYTNTEAEPNSMARYTDAGALFTAAPSVASHATPRSYVDNAIAAGGIQEPQTIQGEAATTVLDDTTPLAVVVNASIASQTITLDQHISLGKTITIIRVDNGQPTNTVTIDPDGWMINGVQNAQDDLLTDQWSVLTFKKIDEADWVAY